MNLVLASTPSPSMQLLAMPHLFFLIETANNELIHAYQQQFYWETINFTKLDTGLEFI